MAEKKSVFPDPSLRWQGNTPESTLFAGKYFTQENALAESHYIFIKGIGAPEIWQDKPDFTIIEAGFGCGLNFLNTWHHWQQTAPASANLHYIAIDAFPLTTDDILKATAPFDVLGDLRQQLADQLPPHHPGFHRIVLGRGRVRLTLLYGDVMEMLQRISPSTTFDACYLDGFTPRRNPDMWTPDVFKKLSQHAKPDARLATYTAAEKIQCDLSAAGVVIETRPGRAHQQDCLQGRFTSRPTPIQSAPWFAPPPPQSQNPTIAIIGAGIAGAAMAYALKSTHSDIVIIDAEKKLAAAASGNPVGILHPRLTSDNSFEGQFHAQAYLHTLNTLKLLDREGFNVQPGNETGLLALPLHDRDKRRQHKLAENFALPGTHMRSVLKNQVRELTGIEIESGGLWFEGAGCIDPVAVCQALTKNTTMRLNQHVERFEKTTDGWALIGDAGQCIMESHVVILANALHANRLLKNSEFSEIFAMNPKRGQINFAATNDISQQLKAPITYGGYITPPSATNNQHSIGATFEDWPRGLNRSDWQPLQTISQQRNYELLHEKIPSLKSLNPQQPIQGRASLRATTADRLVIAGGVPDSNFYQKHYGDLRHGKSVDHYPNARYQPGLYCLTGLGSRGFQTALLAAEAVVSTLFSTPLPIPEDIMHAVHPARFLLRDLKKN